uniref:Deoxyribonuclease 1 like 4, tandem duplicate 1 n=1 Tax=Sinocyclocheilus rhinocerous TaxID=307959 RepID=A0A673MC20_9TELE
MKVTTFNIQKFGKSKLSDLFVLKTLIKVSIIVILEVVDSSGDSVDNFPEELNKFNKTHYYTLEISTRLGRGNYKEQFMFLYSQDYSNDTKHDLLEDLVLMPVHTKPEDSVKELDELYDVFQNVKMKWKTDVKHYNFHWLITDDVDTITRSWYIDDMLKGVVLNLFFLNTDLLSNTDHYPVEVELKKKLLKRQRKTHEEQLNDEYYITKRNNNIKFFCLG